MCVYIYAVYELHINESNKKVIGIKRLIAFVRVNTLHFISSSEIFLSINTIHQDGYRIQRNTAAKH